MILNSLLANLRGDKAKALASLLNEALPKVRPGSICMWGDWFGRPADNLHHLVSAESDGQMVKIHFDQGETLTLWNPKNFWVSNGVFRIGRADRVRFEWFIYLQQKSPENRRFREYVLSESGVQRTTDFEDGLQSILSLDKPAVEILG